MVFLKTSDAEAGVSFGLLGDDGDLIAYGGDHLDDGGNLLDDGGDLLDDVGDQQTPTEWESECATDLLELCKVVKE